ncbi:ribonuclease H-like domain-containing protein [Tanacetum coccineum]
MEQYISKTRGNYRSGVVRPKINDKNHFEIKGQYLKELRKSTFNGLEHEDANEHIEKVLGIVDLFHIPEVTQDQPKSTKTSNGLAAIQAQLNNLGREIKKVNEKVYAAQVGCELYKGPHYTKDGPLKEEGNTLEEAYCTQFGAPYQPGGHYRAARPGFYQCNNKNSSYPDRRKTLEESLTKFMAESAKRHEENSNIIKEIRASIKHCQMSKVLQERGIRGLSGLTEPNPRDHVTSISTAKVDSSKIRRIGCSPYTILEAYDHTLPQKEKDPGSFTLPYFIHNVYFDKARVDLGASVNVMPFSTYTNLGLGILSHTRLTIELVDRTINQPRGIAKNVLVRIGKFIFPIDFIILDIPEDDDVSLILGLPFLSTAYSKIDVYKRKNTLRVGEEKLIFKSIKPATSIIKRVFMLKDLDSRPKLVREDDESFDPLYGNYIELNDLDTPLKLKTNQDVYFEPTFINKPDNVKTISEYCYKIKFSYMIGYKNVNAEFISFLSVNLLTKSFYYSIIKDKDNHEGKSPAETLIDIPIFVGKFSILLGFIIIDDEDVIRDVALGMPFFMKYMSCQMIMKKFAHRNKCKQIMDK